jgi:PAS domain S-box-containing protein
VTDPASTRLPSTTFTSAGAAGQMGARVREFPWQDTPLGPLDGWPQSLRCAVAICLGSRFPMYIWWGQAQIHIYNDAYAPMLGQRHPAALGRPACEVWGEIWPELGEQAEAVLTRGESTWFRRAMWMLRRHGYPEEAWFTWSQSPLFDDDGAICGLICVCTEETAHVLAERARQKLAEQHQLALDSARMGWWNLDTRSEIVSWDARFAELFGYAGPGSAALDEAFERVHAADRPHLRALLSSTLDSCQARPYSTEFRVDRDDGSCRWIRAHGVAAFAGDGTARHAVGLVGTVLDDTVRHEAEEAMRRLLASEQQARARAEEESRLKDEFLATLSHELRTPLNAILGWAQLLGLGRLGVEQEREGIRAIERNARVQAQLVEDLLDMSRISAGVIRLDVRPLDLLEVIDAALATVGAAADARGVQLQRVLAPGFDGRIRGDPARLQQVVWNLLSNAVKFTPAGGQATVALRRDPERIAIEVSDTGQGIAADFLPHVFDRFRQADGSTTRRHGGLGLGLALVRQLVELHGGSVRAASEGENCGACFTVELPVQPTGDDAGRTPHPSEASA